MIFFFFFFKNQNSKILKEEKWIPLMKWRFNLEEMTTPDLIESKPFNIDYNGENVKKYYYLKNLLKYYCK